MLQLTILVLAFLAFSAEAFQSNLVSSGIQIPIASSTDTSSILYAKTIGDESSSSIGVNENKIDDRRSFLSRGSVGLAGLTATLSSFPGIAFADEPASAAVAAATADEESFASIAARASKLSSDVGEFAPAQAVTNANGDTRTAYDFELPVDGKSVPFRDLIRQEVDADGFSKCKVILVSNMKEDDPIARKDIPEFIFLASKYGRNGEFVVMLTPTDQGYYEPDTSQLIRLKLASEYGYGIKPATILTDKTDILGTRALPFWRWMQSNCRTPAGLGRVEGNFEKFLIDGRTGIPLRRYPRKYKPTDIKNDIEAVLAGRPLPPAGANYKEEWRIAAVEAEANTYRFQKGLNYYD